MSDDFANGCLTGFSISVVVPLAIIALLIWAIMHSPPEKPAQPSSDAVAENVDQDGYHCPCCRNNAPERK